MFSYPFYVYQYYKKFNYRRSRHKVEGNAQQAPIVILGSGLVAGPVVEYLARDKNVAVTVGMCIFSLK